MKGFILQRQIEKAMNYFSGAGKQHEKRGYTRDPKQALEAILPRNISSRKLAQWHKKMLRMGD